MSVPPHTPRARRAALAALACAVALAAGSAGAAVTTDGSFTASNGLVGLYRLIVPDGATPADPVGLLVFFHADGAVLSYQADADGLAGRGAASRLAVAAISVPVPGPAMPPASALEDLCWWTPRAASNAVFLEEWIQQVVVASLGGAADLSRVYFAGLSGGGDFALEAHLHLGFQYPGGAVALCGGDLPRADGGSCETEELPPEVSPLPGVADLPPGATDAFTFAIASTDADSYLPFAIAARDYYLGLGFPVAFELAGSGGHCVFSEPTPQLLDRLLVEVIEGPTPDDCTHVDLSAAGVAVDDVPLSIASMAIPPGDPARDELLAKIQAELDAVAALRATIPAEGDVCPDRTDCEERKLKKTTRQMKKHLSKLKGRLVKKAIKRADKAERDALRDQMSANHLQKKAALKSLPKKVTVCGP